MELGRYLVNENLGERNNDTLSRWLLHAIAERMAAYKVATNAIQKRKRESEAADLILRLWKHRAVTPFGIDPLAPYERIFQALRSLLPQANPWLWHDRAANETVAAELYRCLSLLTVSMFLLSVKAIPERSKDEKALHATFLPIDENSILLLFEQVAEFVYPRSKSSMKEAASEDAKATLHESAQSVRALIERTRVALDEALIVVERAESTNSRRKVNTPSKARQKTAIPPQKAASKSRVRRSRSTGSSSTNKKKG